MLAFALFIGGGLALAGLEFGAPAGPPNMIAGLHLDKAHALIDGCQGLALGGAAVAEARMALLPLSDSLDQRFVVRAAPGGIQFEAIEPKLRLRHTPAGVQLAEQGDVFTLSARSRGQFAIARQDGTPFRLNGCERPWRIEQFPVITPTRRDVWVDSAAAPNGDGSSQRPFAAIQAAVSRARAGDFIRVAPGIYRENVRFTKASSGTPEAWVVLAASAPLQTLIVGASQEPVIDLARANHIEINGLVLTNTGTGDCLYGRSGSHHRIIGLYVSGCGGGGIGLTGDFETIEGNVAAHNAKRSIWQNSGIVIWQPKAQALRPKESAQVRLRVRRNAAFLNDNHILAPGSNLVTDGNGIILDDGRNTQGGSKWPPYPHRALVEHNLVFGNGGSGLRVFRTDRVLLRYNTSYANDRSRLARGSGQAEIGSNECFDCLWTGNLAVKPAGEGRQRVVFDYNTRAVRYENNVFFDARAGLDLALKEGPSAAKLDLSRNHTGARPVFARPELDETAYFLVLGWEGPPPEPHAPVGARMELLPSLLRPEVLKGFDETREAPH